MECCLTVFEEYWAVIRLWGMRYICVFELARGIDIAAEDRLPIAHQHPSVRNRLQFEAGARRVNRVLFCQSYGSHPSVEHCNQAEG